MGRVDVNIGTEKIQEGEGPGGVPELTYWRVSLATHDDFGAVEAPAVHAAAMVEPEAASFEAIGAFYAGLPSSPINVKRAAWWAALPVVERRRFRRGLQAIRVL